MNYSDPPNMRYAKSVVRGVITAEQLQELNAELDDSYELVRGALMVREPPGMRHGGVARNLFVRLDAYVHALRLGRAFFEVGYLLSRNPDTVRGPDVSFVRADRLSNELPAGFFDGPPDLAVEVVSPNDRFPLVEQKVWQYLDAGTREVWVIHPAHRTVTVRHPDGSSELLEVGATLSGAEIVAGFACSVAELFV